MKRRIKIVAIFMTIAVLCGVLAGCSLVSTNTERQAGRVMASVNVDLVKEFGNDVKVLGEDWDYNITLTVTRREVISTVNYAINYYSQLYQQYGYTYSYEIDTLVESAISTLQTEKYTAIMSMGQLLKNATTSGRKEALYCLTEEYQAKYGKTLVPEGVLTIAERYDAISSVNENMQSSIDKYVETYTKDERDTKVSAASDELSALYEAGYFVDSVTLGYLNDAGEFVQGVYKDYVIDDNDEDTKDLNYEKIYGRYTLIKYKDGAKVKGDDDKFIYGYVNMPIDSNDLTLAEKENADFVDASITTKIATITIPLTEYHLLKSQNDRLREQLNSLMRRFKPTKVKLPKADLTEMEKTVFEKMISFKTTKDIAFELVLSDKTIISHRNAIYQKLDVHSREELLYRYFTNDLGAEE